MQAAARDLDIELTVAWGERDRRRIVALGVELAEGQPDYMLVVNEYRSAVPIIQAAQRNQVSSLMAFSDLTLEDIAILNGGGGIRHLMGGIMPDNPGAGMMTGRALIRAARGARAGRRDRLPLIAIGGSRSTPAASLRLDGFLRVLRQDGGADLLDNISVNWSREEAYQRAMGLLRRQPQVAGIWCANDDIALGAMDAATELGRQPGKDIFVVGTNWQAEALEALVDGRMSLSAGGHFLVGAWALGLLRDHYDSGHPHVGSIQQVVTLAAMDQARAAAYLQHFAGDAWERMDYRRFRGDDSPHSFTVEPLLTKLPPASAGLVQEG